jgi:hypothetical protein
MQLRGPRVDSPLASSITKLGYVTFVVPKEPLPTMTGERPRGTIAPPEHRDRPRALDPMAVARRRPLGVFAP